jgi:hypothetical protein
MKGISTNRRTTDNVACLRHAGIDFIARYYSTTTQQPEKRLTLLEAQAISAAGMTIVVVYEDGPTHVGYFSTSRGHQDAVNAYNTAAQMLQPSGSGVYFAVDYDATPSDIAQPISDYFRGVRQGFIDAAQGAPSIYSIGVYGSGACCDWIKDHLQIAKYSWLAESTGWHGSRDYTDWNIKQSIATMPLCGFTGGIGGSYEDNVGQNGFGDFKLITPQVVVDAIDAARAAHAKAVRGKKVTARKRSPASRVRSTDWKALFEMKLKASSEIVEGRLLLSRSDVEMLNVQATSGTRGNQASGDLWQKGLGPIPPNPDSNIGNSIETLERHTATISREFRIRPEEAVQPNAPHVHRSAFRVHQDGGALGSAGCIAISNPADFERFAEIMHDLHNHGVDKLQLTLQYT